MPNKDFEFRLDDLQIDGLKLCQNPSFYCFNSDSVVLANLCKVNSKTIAVELGAGSGVISILLCGKRGVKSCTAIEVQPQMFELLQKNIEINSLEDKITPINADILDWQKYLKPESVSLVVVNPPYEKANGKDTVTDNCRTENLATLENFISTSSKLLMFGKDLFMIGKVKRLQEVLTSLSKNNLAVKELTFIYPKLSKGVDTFIVRAIKGGKQDLITHTLIEWTEDGQVTSEFARLYK